MPVVYSLLWQSSLIYSLPEKMAWSQPSSRPSSKFAIHLVDGVQSCADRYCFQRAQTTDDPQVHSFGTKLRADGNGTVVRSVRSPIMDMLGSSTIRAVWLSIFLGVCLLVVGAMPMSSAVQARTPDQCSSPLTISPGDTLSSIARRCGTTLSALVAANPHLHDPDILPVGMALVLPQGSQGDEATPIAPVAEAHIISVEPSVLTPGGRVIIAASNLPPRARVWIKGGTSRSPKHHLILQGGRVDA
jgi:hypothetical protein